jgi:hypothetical protein
MGRLLGCLSLRLYPPAAIVFFFAFLGLWGHHFVALASSRVVATVSQGAAILCLAAAAVINSRTPRFRAAQAYWAGRSPNLAMVAFGVGGGLFLLGLIYQHLEVLADPETWFMPDSPYARAVAYTSLFSEELLLLGVYIHGLALHVFTPLQKEAPPPPVSSPLVLRVIAWLGGWLLLTRIALHLLFQAEPDGDILSDLDTWFLVTVVGGGLCVGAYVIDAALVNRRAVARVASSTAPPGPSMSAEPTAPGRVESTQSANRRGLTLRGWAAIVFWLGLLVYWVVQHLAGSWFPGHPLSRWVVWSVVGLSALAGVALLALPHPYAQDSPAPSVREEEAPATR